MSKTVYVVYERQYKKDENGEHLQWSIGRKAFLTEEEAARCCFDIAEGHCQEYALQQGSIVVHGKEGDPVTTVSYAPVELEEG